MMYHHIVVFFRRSRSAILKAMTIIIVWNERKGNLNCENYRKRAQRMQK